MPFPNDRVVYCMLVAIMVGMGHLDKQVKLVIMDQVVLLVLLVAMEEKVVMVGRVGLGQLENVVLMELKPVM